MANSAFEAKFEQLYSSDLEVYQKERSEESLTEFREYSKKISQLIAKSWLPNDPEAAMIKAFLLEGNSDKIKELFKRYDIPVLDDYTYIVDWNNFYGRSDEQTKTIYIPYPPRPMEVTDVQLTEWVNDNDPNIVDPTAPYIPYSCLCC